MQIVIDIPKHIYEHIKEVYEHSHTVEATYSYIYNGTPLPAHHGRLIDADEYKEHLYACETNGRPLHIMELEERLATIDNVPTIIEADSEVTQ